MANYSVSDAVKEIVPGMHFLRFPLQEDLINFSALARFLKPLVEARVGEKVSSDAIILALKKHVSLLHSQPFHVFEVFKDAKLSLRTGMCVIHFQRTEEIHKKLVEFQRNINWASGEKMYLLQRSEEISVVALLKYERQLLALAPPKEILDKYSNLALITVQFPPEYFDSFGILEYLARQFSDLGVSIKEIFSSHDKDSILFDEDKASIVYEKLSNAIKTSAEIVEMAQTQSVESKGRRKSRTPVAHAARA